MTQHPKSTAWCRLTASNWFYPALFPLLGAVLALAMIWLDRSGAAQWLGATGLLMPSFTGGASDMLAVMAGSMIGTAASVFAITIGAVAYASSNYGPRLMNNFLTDRGNQFALGVFLGSFVYALIVMRMARVETGAALGSFTPQLSLTMAYLLMAISVAVLIWFLNHIPNSTRMSTVVDTIGQRLLGAIETTYPVEDAVADIPASNGGEAVLAIEAGYINAIDFAALDGVAQQREAIFSLAVRTGDFVHRDLPLLRVEGCNPGDLAEEVRPAFVLSAIRTKRSDPRSLIDELVEIGMRALSPGINDPFTAADALNQLGAATAELGRRSLYKDVFKAADGDCRVIPCTDDFAHFVDRGFGTIRSLAATRVNAAQVMLEAMENAARAIRHPARREALRLEAEKLVEQTRLSLTGPDLQAVEERHARFAEAVPAKPVRAVS